MQKTISKTAAVLVGVPAISVALLAGAFFLTSVDKTVRSGVAYGFTIGETKQEVFARAKESPASHHGVYVGPPYITLDVDADDSFELARRSDRWTMFLGEKPMFFDSLRLRFEGDRLAEIHRYRQLFELP